MIDGDIKLYALRDALTHLQSLLALSPWPPILANIRTELESDTSRDEAVKTLKSYFGGMGSLNDVFLCEENHNLPAGRTVAAANKELDSLLDEIFGYLFPGGTQAGPEGLPARIRYAFRANE